MDFLVFLEEVLDVFLVTDFLILAALFLWIRPFLAALSANEKTFSMVFFPLVFLADFRAFSNSTAMSLFVSVFLLDTLRALFAVFVTGMHSSIIETSLNDNMVKKLISQGKKIFTSPQKSVLSAATIIMLMVVASRVLGLIRQRTLAAFFTPDELSLFFAAFRLPDLVFEVLVFGTFSSAFIPVFTKAIKGGKKNAWGIASSVVNIWLLIFIAFALLVGLRADSLYGIFAPGFEGAQREEIVRLARILFAAQGFFVVSYVLTGVLESLRRFLVPALAPLFYNLGIILGTVFLTPKFGLFAPAIGVFLGALGHFAIQLPLAIKLGFRFSTSFKITKEVKKIGRLAAPRVLEVSFLQISKLAELFFASLISTASYTFYTFGNTLQLLPIGLFGTSIAKAALPTLARQSDDLEKFRKTFLNALFEIVFLALPLAVGLIILRIPLVRLIFGTDIFSWEATVQTGLVVSAFAVGVVFQTALALIARSFYALQDTKTPVIVSIIAILLTVAADYFLVIRMGLPVWGLALAFSIGGIFQATTLFYLLRRKIGGIPMTSVLGPILKSGSAALVSGSVMFFMLKFFDRAVWVKRLSFINNVEAIANLPFEKFVLDTRYTFNLLALTLAVAFVGGVVYLGVSILLRSDQVWIFFNLVRKTVFKRKVSPVPTKESEPISPTPTDSAS